MTNSENLTKKTPRTPKFWEALISLIGLVAMLVIGIVVYHVDPHIPLIIGTIIAAIVSVRLGYSWDDIQKFMVKGINQAMVSILILSIIGVLIGTWIDSGVVPTMIYYGLKILKPNIFFLASCLICSITSLATGTSWGSMGTMGVALMGIGYGLGMNPAMTAGAIISGAYFGDKISPLSDTTNLAPAMAGTDVMSHIKFMLKSTGVVYIIALIFYTILGFTQHQNGSIDISSVTELSNALDDMFNINPILLLPPLIVIVAIALKVPAIPGLIIGIASGSILGLIFQPNCTIGTLFDTGMNGFVPNTDVEALADLLNTGGLINMAFSILMTIIAMAFGGIMQETHQFEVIVNQLKKLAKTPASLVGMTEITCIISNAVMPEQYISIVVPGSMYSEEYKKRGLTPTTLSNALESSGTVTSALIPWNTCGVFITTTLGLSALDYGVWAVFNWLTPIIGIIFAVLGWNIAKVNNSHKETKIDHIVEEVVDDVEKTHHKNLKKENTKLKEDSLK